jgi:hypothetical protein
MSLLIYYQSFIQAYLKTLLDDHAEELIQYQVLKQQLVFLERQFSETVFQAGLDKHKSEITQMLKTYGRTLFEKKRREQAEHFHSLILEQKIKPEYDSLDKLVEERARIANEV